MSSGSYRDAGVDTHKAADFIRDIKADVRSTQRAGADTEIGGFGGMFDLAKAGFKDPILVAATDGVGTKLKIALETGQHGTVGIDLVAMCVNDIVVQGAEPLFFLDYLATGKLITSVAKDVISGITIGCQEAGCALIGGETAEMPGFYAAEDYDLAGFAVGAAERNSILNGNTIKPHDLLIGLTSSGLHSNGFSLIRYVLNKNKIKYKKSSKLKKWLLEPTKIYVKELTKLIDLKLINGGAHITGGGIKDNLSRIIPEGKCAKINLNKIKIKEVFSWLKKNNISENEMIKTFNCGVGFIVIIKKKNLNKIKKYFEKEYKPYVIGKIIKGKSKVLFDGKINW